MAIISTRILVLALALVSNAMAVNASPVADRDASLVKSCEKGPVLHTNTLHTADGQDMKVTVEYCGTPATLNKAREPLPFLHDIRLEKRQMPSVCNQTCVQSCHFNGNAAPDCSALITTINSLDGDTFTAPPGTRTIFEVGNCEVSFIHGLNEAVQGCFSWLSPLVTTMNQCLSSPPNNEGDCFQGDAAFSFDLVLAKSGTF